MKVWQKIVVAPFTAITFLIAFGALSYAMVSHQHSALSDLYNNRFQNYLQVSQASEGIGQVHSNVYRLFTWIGNLKEDQIKKITGEQLAQIDRVAKNVEELAASPRVDERERATAQGLLKKLAKYRSDVDTAIDLSGVDVSTGMSAMQTADAGFQAMLKDFGELVQIEKVAAQASYEGTRENYGKLTFALFAILALALVASAAITFFMSRAIVRPLNNAIKVAGSIAAGDLSSEIDVKGRDETAELLRALQHMNESLREIVKKVRTGTASISSASNEIAAGNADLSHRTEQQAASLEETASSMEEFTSRVKQSAESAQQGNQLAARASEVASKGGEVVGKAVATMSGIRDAASKISEIIGVIDGIAFQTNILALNAAVEAARAGEQGRGFAVVASEVRTLAHRSAAAAKEIKALITDSVRRVEDGTELVNCAGSTMGEVVDAIGRVTHIMEDIAAAAKEESSGIEQVNQAVTRMDEMTQRNAALVEEAAAAAESMRDQAHTLEKTVGVFRMPGEAHASNEASHASDAPRDDEDNPESGTRPYSTVTRISGTAEPLRAADAPHRRTGTHGV